jgi:hypothetical protein
LLPSIWEVRAADMVAGDEAMTGDDGDDLE